MRRRDPDNEKVIAVFETWEAVLSYLKKYYSKSINFVDSEPPPSADGLGRYKKYFPFVGVWDQGIYVEKSKIYS